MFSIQSKEKKWKLFISFATFVPKHTARCEAASQVRPEPSMHFSQEGSERQSPVSRPRTAPSPHSEVSVVLQAVEVSGVFLNLLCQNDIPLPERKPDDTGAHLLVLAGRPREPRAARSQAPTDFTVNTHTRPFCACESL